MVSKIASAKTRFFSPYKTADGKTKTNIPGLRSSDKQNGVYIIKKVSTDAVIYVGFSKGNLYKTIFRHFEDWNDKQRERITYKKTGFLVRVIYCKTATQASILEKRLIDKYKPKDNTIMYELAGLSLAQMAKADELYKTALNLNKLDEVPF